MNGVIWSSISVVAGLLTWDWLVKRKRVAVRPELRDQEFLNSYRGPRESPADAQILEARRRIARELGLPESKIQPHDELTELRDHYCLVVSGHLALDDLFNDLQAAGEGGSQLSSYPDTVHEYFTALLKRSGRSVDEDEAVGSVK